MAKLEIQWRWWSCFGFIFGLKNNVPTYNVRWNGLLTYLSLLNAAVLNVIFENSKLIYIY